MVILFLVLGFILLIGGAELLVRGASKLASRAGISSLVVGLTVVSLGTSAPELAVGLDSGFRGQTDLLIGNVIGSNIFNVLFILGVSALVTPLVVNHKLIRLDVPLMIGCSLLLGALGWDGTIHRWEALLLVLLLICYTMFLLYQSRKEGLNNDIGKDSVPKAESGNLGIFKSDHWIFDLFFMVTGLFLLVMGANWLVDSAVQIAQNFGVSELIIGLTIISVGTSLPEVATSIMAGLKGERDIAVGNVVGSNIFNILGIVGITGIIIPQSIGMSPAILGFDLPVMTAVAIACLPIFFTGHIIVRWEGMVFLGYYLAYLLYLILDARGHDLLPIFNNVMLGFVLPITFLTLIIVAYREFKQKEESKLQL